MRNSQTHPANIALTSAMGAALSIDAPPPDALVGSHAMLDDASLRGVCSAR